MTPPGGRKGLSPPRAPVAPSSCSPGAYTCQRRLERGAHPRLVMALGGFDRRGQIVVDLRVAALVEQHLRAGQLLDQLVRLTAGQQELLGDAQRLAAFLKLF